MIYLGEPGQIPFLCKADIAAQADGLLDECWDGKFPVDIEAICDYLEISVVPIKGLADKYNIDAYISSDFRIIYVDQEAFHDNSFRYRFSLAHELGHYILHRDYYSNRVANFNEWQGLSQVAVSNYAEYQANYFAGNLLAPEGALITFLDDNYNGNFARNCWSKSHREFGNTMRRVQMFFNISNQVTARRIRDIFIGADSFDEIAAALHK